jgi:hypothetical protein
MVYCIGHYTVTLYHVSTPPRVHRLAPARPRAAVTPHVAPLAHERLVTPPPRSDCTPEPPGLRLVCNSCLLYAIVVYYSETISLSRPGSAFYTRPQAWSKCTPELQEM